MNRVHPLLNHQQSHLQQYKARTLLDRSIGNPPTFLACHDLQVNLCGYGLGHALYVQQLAQHGWLKLSYGKLEILSIHTWHAFARSQREDSVNNLNASIQDLLALLKAANTPA